MRAHQRAGGVCLSSAMPALRACAGYEFLLEGKTRRAGFYRERLEYELQEGKWSRRKARVKKVRRETPLHSPKVKKPGLQEPGPPLTPKRRKKRRRKKKQRKPAADAGGVAPATGGGGGGGATELVEPGRHQLLQRVRLCHEPWLDSEVVGVLEGGEVVQIERSFRDGDGLVWALCASGGWVPPDPASGAPTLRRATPTDALLASSGNLEDVEMGDPELEGVRPEVGAGRKGKKGRKLKGNRGKGGGGGGGAAGGTPPPAGAGVDRQLHAAELTVARHLVLEEQLEAFTGGGGGSGGMSQAALLEEQVQPNPRLPPPRTLGSYGCGGR